MQMEAQLQVLAVRILAGPANIRGPTVPIDRQQTLEEADEVRKRVLHHGTAAAARGQTHLDLLRQSLSAAGVELIQGGQNFGPGAVFHQDLPGGLKTIHQSGHQSRLSLSNQRLLAEHVQTEFQGLLQGRAVTLDGRGDDQGVQLSLAQQNSEIIVCLHRVAQVHGELRTVRAASLQGAAGRGDHGQVCSLAPARQERAQPVAPSSRSQQPCTKSHLGPGYRLKGPHARRKPAAIDWRSSQSSVNHCACPRPASTPHALPTSTSSTN